MSQTVDAYEVLAVRQYLMASALAQGYVGVARILSMARIVAWKKDCWDLAQSGHEAFRGTKLTLPPETTAEFWYFDDFHVDDGDYEAMGGLSIQRPTRLEIVNFEAPRIQTAAFKFDPKAIRFTRNEHEAALPVGDKCSYFLALREFMSLKIAAVEPVSIPRPQRRRMQRANEHIPEIRIVQLRQREAGDSHGGEREYDHRWIVQGHWRRLHEPRKADGAEVTFVHAYIKGPENAPLLQPRQTIFNVNR